MSHNSPLSCYRPPHGQWWLKIVLTNLFCVFAQIMFFQGKLKLSKPQFRSTKQSRATETWVFTSFCNFLKTKELTESNKFGSSDQKRIAPGWRAARCVEKWHQCEWARDSHGWAKCDQMHLLLPCIFTDWAEGQTLQTCFSRVCCHCHYQVHIDASIVAPVGSKASLCTVSLFYLLLCLSLSSLPLSHFLFLLFDKTLNVFFSRLPWHLYINI